METAVHELRSFPHPVVERLGRLQCPVDFAHTQSEFVLRAVQLRLGLPSIGPRKLAA